MIKHKCLYIAAHEISCAAKTCLTQENEMKLILADRPGVIVIVIVM